MISEKLGRILRVTILTANYADMYRLIATVRRAVILWQPYFISLRSSSDSSPFFTLAPPDFFTPPFARRLLADAAPHLENNGCIASPRRGDILVTPRE